MSDSGLSPKQLLIGTVFYVNFLSLACQLLWVRRFNLLFGSTAAVFSSVLCAFLLGLALGAELGGRWVARTERPWAALGGLLLALGGYVAVSLWIFELASRLYLAVAPANLAPAAAALSKLPFVLLLVVPPTMLIGAVLPFGVGLLGRQVDVGRAVAVLYGADTLGAALGALVSGFVLVPYLGLQLATLLLGAACAGLGLLVRRGPLPTRAPRPANVTPKVTKKKAQAAARRATAAAPEPAVAADGAEASPLGWRRLAVLASFTATGAAALLLETGWNRFFYLLNGTSVFSLSVVLTGFLTGIGLGSVLVRGRLDGDRDLPTLVAFLHLAVALGGLVVFRSDEFFGRRYLAFFASAESYGGFQLQVWLLVFLLVAVATLAMGANFPVITRLLASDRARAGAETGRVYLVNTAGAVVGALLGEFVLLPRLGFDGLMATVAAVYLVSAALFLALSRRRSVARWVAAAVLAVGVLALTPPLRPYEPPPNAVYYSGVRRGTWASFAELNAAQTTVWRRQGFYGQVAVLRAREGSMILKHNGKSDASSSAVDNFAQLVLGHLPLLLHPDARNVLNIGLGGGITLGAIVAHDVERVVQVEIDPLVATAARTYFGPYNRRALEDPRVHLVIDDGRNYVARPPAPGERPFDVIVSEPPNIWVSGVSGLFTEEFYRAAHARLAPGGLLCQWLPLYELDDGDFAAALRTIGTVFPHLAVWTNGAVAIVIASDAPVSRPPGAAIPPGALSDLASVGISAAALPDFLARPDLPPATVAAWQQRAAFVNRDDRPLLEFHCARNLFLQLRDPNSAVWRTGLGRTL